MQELPVASALTPLTVQRLAYVRYLYQEGVEQSRQPSVLAARALTSFHDAVENFLGLVAEQLGVDLRARTEFLHYWEAIKPEMELPSKASMKRLNDARVALKHHGTFPSIQGIEQAREAVADFLTTVTPKVFNVYFDAIDMVDLVTQPETARILREAQSHAEIGDYVNAMAGLDLAFKALLDHYSRARPFEEGMSPFSFGPNLRSGDKPRVQGGPASHTNDRLRKLSDIATAVQEAMRAMSLGIDYPRLARFKILAPRVHLYGDGRMRYIVTERMESLSADEYSWARDFVVESALSAAGADGIQDLWEAQRDASWKRSTTYSERVWTGSAGSGS